MELRERYEKVKTHVHEHKLAYIGGAAGIGGLVVGGTAVVIFGKQVEVAAIAKNTAIVQWKPNANVVQETIVQMPARGHRGNVLWCNELERAFPSQNAAAKALDISASNLSQNLRGQQPSIGGYTFQNLGENLNEVLTVAA